jgi:hypothetical protein
MTAESLPTPPTLAEDDSCRALRRGNGPDDRPGSNVHTDATGKTYEGNTGVSGETAATTDADARELETANDEGMPGMATPTNLPAVQAALRQLDTQENPTPHHPPLPEGSAADAS